MKVNPQSSWLACIFCRKAIAETPEIVIEDVSEYNYDKDSFESSTESEEAYDEFEVKTLAAKETLESYMQCLCAFQVKKK